VPTTRQRNTALDIEVATDKQGYQLVRWAAVEAIQRTDKHSRLGRVCDQVAQRRGCNIGKVAAAREFIELIFSGCAMEKSAA
jgi:hypothetical protein